MIMATPLKSLQITTKVLSPLSPRLLSSFSSSGSFAKRLEFPSSTDQQHPSRATLGKHVQTLYSASELKKPAIVLTNVDSPHPVAKLKQQATTNNNVALLINTPNKLNLLKFGIVQSSLFQILGKGSFGTVIKAIYQGKEVAAKVVKIDKNKSSTKPSLLNEYNALNLSHKNIVKTLDIIVSDCEQHGIILMEFCYNSEQLQSVLDNVKGYRLEIATIRQFGIDVCQGVDYCHRQGVLHLDIKPQNILVCDNVCKLCDFGNSMNVDSSLELAINYEFKGTVAYTAPEILKGLRPDKKSDVYSLGILFWQMQSRQTPYKNLNRECIIYKVVKFNLRPYNHQEINKIRTKNDAFAKIIYSCCNEEPRLRPEIYEILDILSNTLC